LLARTGIGVARINHDDSGIGHRRPPAVEFDGCCANEIRRVHTRGDGTVAADNQDQVFHVGVLFDTRVNTGELEAERDVSAHVGLFVVVERPQGRIGPME
jgi:hypothetical protein